jgi:hypothetical protein
MSREILVIGFLGILAIGFSFVGNQHPTYLQSPYQLIKDE